MLSKNPVITDWDKAQIPTKKKRRKLSVAWLIAEDMMFTIEIFVPLP